MTQYYIVEIQQYANGEYGHLVYYAYDTDTVMAQLKAESKYYEVLSAAAISELPNHAVILFNADGEPQMFHCYKHVSEESEEEEETSTEE